jgi:hypothetical protein
MSPAYVESAPVVCFSFLKPCLAAVLGEMVVPKILQRFSRDAVILIWSWLYGLPSQFSLLMRQYYYPHAWNSRRPSAESLSFCLVMRGYLLILQ